MKPIRERYLHAAIADLHYDFTAFKIDHFLKHFQARRNRPLEVKRYPFQSYLFAFCYQSEVADYIVVNSTLHRVHQLHSLLHEIAHLHLGHIGVNLHDALGAKLSETFGFKSETGHVRSVGYQQGLNLQQEEEAELFVQLIRREIAAANRLHELHTPTSIPEIEPYVRGMGFTR